MATNNTNKNTKQVKDNYFIMPLSIGKDTTESVTTEIRNIVESTRFNKISVPVYMYKYLTDNTLDSNDKKTIIVGYIKNYSTKLGTFQVFVYDGNKNIVKYLKDPVIVPSFTEYDGKLGVITKFVITPESGDVL